MTKREPDHLTLPAPALVSPKEAHVVDGSAVTFDWTPVAGAADYVLQVAADTQFDQVVFEEGTGDATSLTVYDVFPVDGKSYYWRVIARDSEGVEGTADHVESFVSGTAEAAVAGLERPDERFGPAPALFRSAAADVAAELGGEDAFAAEEAAHGVQHEGVEAGQILGIALAVLAALVVAIIVVFQWTGIRSQHAAQSMVGAAPYQELREIRTEATRLLGQYDVVEGQPGVYRIPIDRAIDLMATEAYQQREQQQYSEELPLDAGF
jgi:hypothetical protein